MKRTIILLTATLALPLSGCGGSGASNFNAQLAEVSNAASKVKTLKAEPRHRAQRATGKLADDDTF